MTSTDPRELLARHEARVLARLRGTAAELKQRPSTHSPRTLDWVRAHPHTSLAVATGAGFLLAPGKKTRSGGALKRNAAQLTRATKLMLYGRLMRSLTEAWGPTPASASRAPATPDRTPDLGGDATLPS